MATSTSVVAINPTQLTQLQQTVVAGLPATATPANANDVPIGVSAVTLVALTDAGAGLVAVSSVGMRSFEPSIPHFVAIYGPDASGWHELAHMSLNTDDVDPDYIDEQGFRQVKVSADKVWLEVQSGVGAHGGCYQLLSFANNTLKPEVSSCHSSPGAGFLQDIDGDGIPEVLLDTTENYIFCYACGVRRFDLIAYQWDGSTFKARDLEPLSAQAPAELRTAVERAIAQAQAGLWKDASATIDSIQMPAQKDATLAWDSGLIRQIANGRKQAINDQAYPLLDTLFYGDYAAALDILRAVTPEQRFDPAGPLIVGTVAEGWQSELTQAITSSTELALDYQPDMAAAHFLRGWALQIASPGSPDALAEIARAAELEPQEQLYTESLSYLKP